MLNKLFDLDYNSLKIKEIMPIFTICELQIGNIIGLSNKKGLQIVVVESISNDIITVRPLIKNECDSSPISIDTESLTDKLGGIKLTVQILSELGFESKEDKILLDPYYRLYIGSHDITLRKYDDKLSIHIDNCDFDTIGVLHDVETIHQFQNFIQICGITI